MDSISTKIKSENISDIEENEEYLCAITQAPPEVNADPKVTFDYNDMKIYRSTSESYRISVATRFVANNAFDKNDKDPYALKIKTEQEEAIVNMLPECVDTNIISDLEKANTESGTHPLHYGMTCKIEETQILFGTESALAKAQRSSEFANGNHRSDRKLSNWVDGTEKCIFKEELTEDKDTSPKCPDRQKNESFIAKYRLDCDVPLYKCPDCDKRLKYKQSLERHQMSWHSKLKPHKCLDCEKSFTRKAFLDQHQMSKHSKPKPHKCSDCEKDFVTKPALCRHQMSQHSKPKPHKCPDCDESFVTKYWLGQHQMHRHSKPKPHKCPDCDQSFTARYILGQHQMSRHSKPKPHKCPDCDRSFLAKQHLSQHQMTHHSKLKPYKCLDCEKRFTRRVYLDQHQCPNIRNLRCVNTVT